MEGSKLQGVRQMGFKLYGYPGGSNSRHAAPNTNEDWPQTIERLRWGIRASTARNCESAGCEMAGIDTEAANRSAACASVEDLSAAVAAVADGSRLRAASPGGFTAPG